MVIATIVSFSLESLSAISKVKEANASLEILRALPFLSKALFFRKNSKKRIAAIRLFPSAKVILIREIKKVSGFLFDRMAEFLAKDILLNLVENSFELARLFLFSEQIVTG